MSSFSRACDLALVGLVCLSPRLVSGQSGFVPQGGEYPVAGLLRGDQVFLHASVRASGGYLVWQDNATDGDGSGISARQLKNNLLGSLSVFRVNEQGAGEQQNAKVSLLKNGGAVFVWQGGPAGGQDIYARFLDANGTFATGDLRVNSYTEGQQMNPAVAVLPDDNVIVTWSSYGQDGSMQGVFARALSSAGERVGGEFQVNQHSPFNQRTPAVAALSQGGFVVAWISEQKRFENSIDVYARIYDAGRAPLQDEFLVNVGTNICANPVLNAFSKGGFMVGWSQRDIASRQNGWDVFVRSFNPEAAPAGEPVKVNMHVNGNHYAPQIAGEADTQLVAWTSYGQDGSFEGVFGRFITPQGRGLGPEFQINTTTAAQQIHPTVVYDGRSQFLAVWSSFIDIETSFDLLAQRFAPAPLQPTAPFVSALSSSRLSVTWPEAGTNTVKGYEIYVDDSPQPILVTGNIWSLGALPPASSHSFRLAYTFADGGRSALSPPVNAITWGSDENLDGLPDDWQGGFWGGEASRWPEPKTDSDGDGATNLEEFLAGTSPKDPASVLRTKLVTTPQGTFLHWNTQPGFVYQVQFKSDLSREWAALKSPRFAAGATDSMLIDGTGDAVYYRVQRLR